MWHQTKFPPITQVGLVDFIFLSARLPTHVLHFVSPRHEFAHLHALTYLVVIATINQRGKPDQTFLLRPGFLTRRSSLRPSSTTPSRTPTPVWRRWRRSSVRRSGTSWTRWATTRIKPRRRGRDCRLFTPRTNHDRWLFWSISFYWPGLVCYISVI